MSHAKFSSIDLFVGAGGLTQGFKTQGFNALFANDFDNAAIKTFVKNHELPISSSDPIESINPAQLRTQLALGKGDLDVLLGGPPCQGFSTYGKRDTTDPRNKLYEHYLSILKEFLPKTFVMENVLGILSYEKGQVLKHVIEDASNLGYTTEVLILNAANYGVPQTRRRVFVVGSMGNTKIKEPPCTNQDAEKVSTRERNILIESQLPLWEGRATSSLPPALTVRDAISDLSIEVFLPKETHKSVEYPSNVNLSPYQIEMRKGSECISHHSSKQMLGIRKLRLALMQPGDYGTKIQERLLNGGLSDEQIDDILGGVGLRDLDGCRRQDIEKELELREALQSGGLEMETFLKNFDSGGFANKYRRLHWNSPAHTLVAHMARDCSDFVHPEIDRFISVREAARLQSFPDSYYFVGSQFQQLKQIGNAVPPKLGEVLAIQVRKHLEKSY